MLAKLIWTAIFVFLNGIFVAAEFALVKTRPARLQALAEQGDARAKRLLGMIEELDLYLSACQLGITIASLVLGYLAEPAFAALIELGAASLGFDTHASTTLHVVSFGLALTIVTLLHMVLGEQWPKIWAIHTAERTSLRLSLPLKIFTMIFRPLIVVVNVMSNGLLRLVGVAGGHGEHDADVLEIKGIIGAAATAGNISARQRMFAENILDLVELEIRHVMLPRTQVAFLDRSATTADNLERVRSLGHSRWPLCNKDLDEVVGIVLARDLLDIVLGGGEVQFDKIARSPMFVPDTQPLSRFIVESQQTGHQGAIVQDEHGTMVGMVFLEDALEEIVGPLHDERDEIQAPFEIRGDGVIEMDGGLDLPAASKLLGIELDDTHDTVGGYIIGALGRLPRKGDALVVGAYDAEVVRVGRRRSIARICFTPREHAKG
ncbi:Magnesium and cobalt efflux protein CorC [Enhygromyxa salina]|uniref:Magnesium and cobalt efflux protein CorC n=1 Tax=Enhygromyxa salina TaxID=215803 RepID=A0A0C2DDF0_9BACT|nr:hemolysin family protein [Enhygromyxa salina]KIG19465.1 Magnesium and cobalt efflux protein CorC [Enhygromyxa salina]